MKKTLLFLLICLTTLSAVHGEETVWQDNFDNPATAAAWTFTGKRTTKHRYTCAGFAKENERRILLLQDFDFASQPATALSPKFKTGEAWEIACDFRFTPPDWGADKPPYSFRIKLLDKSGAILCNLDVRYRRMVPGGMLLNRLPIADNTWYRLKLTAKHADKRYDLSVTDINTGNTQELKNLPLASSQSPEQILFEATCGYDSFGVLRIDNLTVSNLDESTPHNRPERSAVHGEETVWQDNFDNPATAAAWTFTGKRTTKHRYTCAGFAKENERRILLLQDFDFASQPATALSPKFKTGEAWKIACDFRFTPPDWGADKPPYSFRIKLLDKSGAILCNLDVRYRRMVPGGMLLNRLPIADNTWYRLKLTAKHADRRYDLSVTDINTGNTQELKDLPLTSSQSPEQILFEAACGYDSFGVLRIDNLTVSNLK